MLSGITAVPFRLIFGISHSCFTSYLTWNGWNCIISWVSKSSQPLVHFFFLPIITIQQPGRPVWGRWFLWLFFFFKKGWGISCWKNLIWPKVKLRSDSTIPFHSFLRVFSSFLPLSVGNSLEKLSGVERVNCTRKQKLLLEFTLLGIFSKKKCLCAEREEMGLRLSKAGRLLTKLAFELPDTFFWKCCQEVLLTVLETLQDESAHFQLQLCTSSFWIPVLKIKTPFFKISQFNIVLNKWNT